MQQNARIKIAMADDHVLFRKGLVGLLKPDQHELLFDVGSGKQFIETMLSDEAMTPDIAIMDINMKDMNGFETVAWLRDNHPDIKILVVSEVNNDEDIVRMLKLGVKGYLTKFMEPEDLYAALQSIAQKSYYYTDFVTNKLIHSIQKEAADASDTVVSHKLWDSLSAKQKEFIRYACTEMNYVEIASKMHVSPKTIDGYRDAVFDCLELKSRVALVLYAIKNKLVTI